MAKHLDRGRHANDSGLARKNKRYPSIGCVTGMRAVKEREDARAGRWWERGSDKECGIHFSLSGEFLVMFVWCKYRSGAQCFSFMKYLRLEEQHLISQLRTRKLQVYLFTMKRGKNYDSLCYCFD